MAFDAAENFPQTSRKRAPDRRLAGEEVRNPTLEPRSGSRDTLPAFYDLEENFNAM
jgi:hypothetical protein